MMRPSRNRTRKNSKLIFKFIMEMKCAKGPQKSPRPPLLNLKITTDFQLFIKMLAIMERTMNGVGSSDQIGSRSPPPSGLLAVRLVHGCLFAGLPIAAKSHRSF